MSGRRKKKPKQPPRMIRHVSDKRYYHSSIVRLPFTASLGGVDSSQRLVWDHQGPIEFDSDTLAQIILHQSLNDAQWFCDSTVFIGETGQAIWDALLSKRGRLVLTVPIYEEIRQWINDPTSNRPIAELVKEALRHRGETAINILEFSRNDMIRINYCEYYSNLIGMRKNGFGLANSIFIETHGRPPMTQELSSYSKDIFGLRAQLLARKGANAKVPTHRYNDEAFVVTAIVDAICTGRETVILTSDEDVYDQFFKLNWLIDTHYRSMLLAEQYEANPEKFPLIHTLIDNDRRAFEGEVLLLSKPSNTLKEVLPKEYKELSQNTFAKNWGFCILLSYVPHIRP
jgi:hypothetical protein